VTGESRLVKEAASLFEADCTRQPYAPGNDHLVVSPENSRELLTAFIKKTKKHLLIYDAKVTDRLILRVLAERIKAGVQIRMFGKVGKGGVGIETRKLPDLRLHVRAMIRDGAAAFVGSQSLRKLELDGRRELGLICRDPRIAKKMVAVFEADWAQAGGSKPMTEKQAAAAAKDSVAISDA
jgi:phosphatidylserine/phosphatidylglycerophosphate/cardiolipin synthase-like enzyme